MTEESFDPEAQVARSEQRTEELSTEGGGGDVSGVGGAPGVVANDPAAGASGGTPGSMSTRKVETINYEISKKVVQSNTPRGKIQKLSIAVLVADPAPPILEDGTPGPAPEPWTDEQLKQFEALARQAVGFDEKRGDLITITNAPFREIDSMPIDAPSFVLNWLPLAESALRGILALGALALFARLVVKPALGAIAAAPSAGRLPANAAEAAARGLSSGSAAELAKGGARAASPEPAVAIAPPAEGVKALRTWLAEG